MDPALAARRDAVLAALDGLPGLRSRGMFGWIGLWAEDGVFFAVMDDERLYFRTDEQNRPAYDAAGAPAFVYSDDAPPAERYRAVPDDVQADPAALLAWAEDAVDAGRRARAAPRARRR